MYLRNYLKKEKKYYSLVSGHKGDKTVEQKTDYYIGRLDKLSQEKITQIEHFIFKKGSKDLLRKFRQELYLEGVNTSKYSLNDIKIGEVLDYGDIVAQHKIFEALNINEVINKHTTKGGGKVDIGSLAEIMAINRNVDPCSRNKLPQWYKSTELPVLLKVNPNSINKDVLIRALGYLQPEVTISIQKEIYETIKTKFSINTEKVYYDLTSTYFEGNCCEIAKRGHPRGHSSKKLQIVVGFVVNEDGILITHSVHEGNTTDVTTMVETVNTLKTKFNISKCTIVADRGLISTKNVNTIESAEFSYILANKRNKIEKQIIVDSEEECVWQNIDEGTKLAEKIVDNKKYVILLNDKMKRNNYMSRVTKLAKTEERLQRIYNSIKKGKIKTKTELIKRTDRVLVHCKTTSYFKIKCTADPLYFTYELIMNNLREATKYDGYAIFSTNETALCVDEVLDIYRERDVVEKAIRTIKSVIDLHPLYVYNRESVCGLVFICALAYQVRSVMKHILKSSNIDMSIDQAFDVLKRLKVVNIVFQGEQTIVRREISTHSGAEELIEVFDI